MKEMSCPYNQCERTQRGGKLYTLKIGYSKNKRVHSTTPLVKIGMPSARSPKISVNESNASVCFQRNHCIGRA